MFKTPFTNVSAPSAGIELTSSQFRPTAAAPQMPNIGAPGADELLDKMEDLESVYQRQVQGQLALQQGLAKLQAEHEHHVASTRDVFGQVTQLLSSTSSLHEKFQTFEGQLHIKLHKDIAAHKDDWLQTVQTQNREFEDQVRKLLANFKVEIVTIARESESRHSSTVAALESVAEKLARNIEAQETIRANHDRLMAALEEVKRQATQQNEFVNRQVDHVLGQSRETNGALKDVRDELARVHENQQNALQLSREETSRKVADLREYCEALVASSLEGFSSDLDEKLKRDSDSTAEALKQLDTTVDELTRRQVEDRQLGGNRHSDLLKSYGKLENQIATVSQDQRNAQLVVENKLVAAVNEIRAAAADQSEKIAEMDRVISATDTTVRLAIGNFNDERGAMQKMTQSLSQQLDSTEQLIRTKLASFSTAERDFVKEQVARVEQDFERKHRRLVESTHQAVQEVIRDTDTAPHIAELRGDLQRLRDEHAAAVAVLEQLARSGAAGQLAQTGQGTNGSGLEGGLESAFGEIKDWLQDVERRMVTRAAVEEQLLSFASQISTLKHATQQAEMALSQRIDAERTAREHDVAQVTNQLQKVQLLIQR